MKVCLNLWLEEVLEFKYNQTFGNKNYDLVYRQSTEEAGGQRGALLFGSKSVDWPQLSRQWSTQFSTTGSCLPSTTSCRPSLHLVGIRHLQTPGWVLLPHQCFVYWKDRFWKVCFTFPGDFLSRIVFCIACQWLRIQREKFSSPDETNHHLVPY